MLLGIDIVVFVRIYGCHISTYYGVKSSKPLEGTKKNDVVKNRFYALNVMRYIIVSA